MPCATGKKVGATFHREHASHIKAGVAASTPIVGRRADEFTASPSVVMPTLTLLPCGIPKRVLKALSLPKQGHVQRKLFSVAEEMWRGMHRGAQGNADVRRELQKLKIKHRP